MSARRALVLAVLILLTARPAAAYRPFVSTDAAVADPKEVEIELGYFNLERTGRDRTFTAPSLVLNYGLARNLEAVGEFRVNIDPEVDITDPGVFLKAVLKEGVLQDKPGLSVAVEAGPLLPSTLPRERHVGFEGIAIVSGRLAPFTVHVNGGAGVDRVEGRVFGIWGIIGELPVRPTLRVVGEVSGESAPGGPPNDSALLGVIWQPTAANVWLDAGIRRGISRGAPDWQFTVGLTFAFSIAPGSRSESPP